MMTLFLAVLAAPVGNAANNVSPRVSDDQMICQRETPTGSLITSRKICMTKAEWNALEQDYRDGLRRTASDEMGRRPGI